MAVNDKQTLSANGQTDEVVVYGPARVVVSNDFGSGTAQVQAIDPEGEWENVVNGSFTAAADKVFDFPKGTRNAIRVDLSGSTSPDLDVWIQSA